MSGRAVAMSAKDDRMTGRTVALGGLMLALGWSLAGPATGATAAVRSAPVVAPASTTRIGLMSFNVCGGVCRRGEVPDTAGFVAATAERGGASVVLLQELCYHQYRRIRELLGAQGFTARFAAQTRSSRCASNRGRGQGFGIAVLVRGPVAATTVKRLPTRPGVEPRLLLGVTAKVAGRSTFVAAVHLSPSPRQGLSAQLAAVSAIAAARAGHPAIIGGDFNALPANPGLDGLYSPAVGGSGRFTELDEHRNDNPKKGGRPTYANRKIDYVFLSDGWFARPLARSTTTGMSDHRVYQGSVGVVTR
jgi:endonuclease/exonuclease/phosphatase family metal-dependent hydrolase